MSPKYLKNIAFFIAALAVIFGVFVSCDNPFTRNLGEKVDVEDPKIGGIDPASGTYIKDTASFSGQASAYRELRSKNPVEVAIARPDKTQPDGWGKYEPWSAEGIVLDWDSKKKAEWSYNLDTTKYDDGLIKIKFRAHDPRLVTETVELTYIVKNGPSVFKMIMPPENPDITLSEMPNDSEIRGQILDTRGIKPGYPRIKIWKEDDPEPDGTKWAVMFLANIDDTNNWTYADRNQRKVDNQANFVFKLADYTIDSEGKVTYTKNIKGEYTFFAPGVYNYRLLTRDTYFYDDSAKYPDNEPYYPRDPIAENGEKEIVTYHPTPYSGYGNPFEKGNANMVKLNPPGERPIITLEPDATPFELTQKPNIYMTDDEPQSRKILTGNSSRNVFELRVRAYHPLTIDRATLEWEHAASGRSGTLVSDDADWNDKKTFADGTFFTFTAKENLADKVTGVKIFEHPDHNAQPYTLKVTAYSTSNESAERIFTVYVSKDIPTVEVQSVKGAATEPLAPPNDFYTVNQNIEVTVNYAATGTGMNQENREGVNRDVVKWFVVEEAGASVFQAQIIAYRTNPIPDNLAFFNSVAYIDPANPDNYAALRAAKSGWVENRTLKFNTTTFADGKNLRLFIIAQDKVQNLGFTSIKLKVDQDSDIPKAKSPTLTAQDEGIDSVEKLFIIINDNGNQNTPSQTRKNILDKDTGVYLTLNDDDGIKKSSSDIIITLTDRNTAGTPDPKSIDVSKIQFSGSSKEWSGELTQAIMAAAINNNGGNPYLKDGIYELTITCRDDPADKVSIGTNDPQAVAASVGPLKFYFCVISNQPAITVTSPGRNAFVTTAAAEITGTITSRIPIQRLWIGNFNPPLTTPPSLPSVTANGGVTLYLNKINNDYTNPVQLSPTINNTGTPNSNGEYIYYWRVQNVLFASASTSEDRTFILRAADNLGNLSPEQWEVKMDQTPPKVDLEDFYFSRPLEIGETLHLVNGKFNFKISGWDNDAIAQSGNNVDIKWWILPSAFVDEDLTWTTPFPTPSTASETGWGGQFTVDNKDAGTGYYEKIINSVTHLKDGATYKLYAIARDRAGNVSTTATTANPTPKVLLQTFKVDQNSDYPKLSDLEPADKRILSSEGGLYIKATVSDDDDFRVRNNAGAITNTAVGHVGIRWATSASGPFGGWTQIPAGAVNFDSNGALNLNYPVSTSADGWKYYQIRVTDVKANKNPDGVTTGPDSLDEASKIFPSDTTTYSFYLKNEKPVINFTGNSGQVFRTRPNLLAALGGNVADSYLASVTVSFDRGTPVPLMSNGAPVPGQGTYNPGPGARFTWNLAEANLNWLPIEFSTIEEGMHIVTITAQDVAGNPESTDWLFYKDTTGPEISFSNIAKIPGNSGSPPLTSALTGAVIATMNASEPLFLTGRFEDLSSPIQTVPIAGQNLLGPTYRIDGAASGPNTGSVLIPDGSGKNAVTWQIPLANVSEGKHFIEIQVSDNIGNVTPYSTTWFFVIDRAIPVVAETDVMTVSGNLGVSQDFLALLKTDDNKRVFSAASANSASTAIVFTLEGYADDVNLNSISVSLRRSSITNPADTALTFNVNLPTVWHESADTYSLQSAEAEKRLTVTKDTTQSGRWKWSFNVLSKDLFALNATLPVGDPCFVSVNAQDAAQFNSEPRHWRFYLDSSAPVPDFANIRPSGEVFDSQDVSLKGTVDDDKRVKNIRYSLSKYNYDDGKWYYCNNSSWTILAGTDVAIGTPATPVPYNTVWSDYPMPTNPGSLESWTLDNDVLKKATVSGTGTIVYGDNILGTNGQGKYKLFIEATDYSLAATDAGNRTVKSVVFHVDRAEPTIKWTGVNEVRTSFRNKNGIIELELTASDINSINASSIKVDIKNSAGTNVYSQTYPTADITASATPSYDSVTGTYTSAITLKPNVYTGSDWPDGRYTLTLKVKDDAGKEASVNRDFTVINTAPSIDIDGYIATGPAPLSVTVPLAITGRNEMKGKFTAAGSPLAFIAYYVAPGGATTAAPGLPATSKDDVNLTTAGKNTLAGYGWRFGDGKNNNLKNASNVNLVTIGNGETNTNVTLLIPDAVNLRAGYAAGNDIVPPSPAVYFPAGKSIEGETVNRLVIYFLVVDEAGNWKSAQYIYWIYPEGDRPTVTISRPDLNEPEEKRLLNGRIRIGGTAKDNVRVKYVWFRILGKDGDMDKAFTEDDGVNIPVWTDLWADANRGNQTADGVQFMDGNNLVNVVSPNTAKYGTGWFMANGGGKAEIPWYANINTNDELAPLLAGRRKITIEVLAEDTMRDEAGNWSVSNAATPHMYSSDTSPAKRASAYVVKGAPEFGSERIKRSASGASPTVGVIGDLDFANTSVWIPVEDANIRKRASYSVTVTHDAGVREIQWMRAGLNPVNLLSSNDSYNTTDYANAISSNLNPTSGTKGIAVKAGPKSPVTSGALTVGKRYLVWKWDATGAGYTSSIPGWAEIPAGTDMRFMIFTANSTATVGTNNILLPENDIGKFEWVVVVDIDADLIDGGKYKYNNSVPSNPQTPDGSYSGKSSLTLRAFENSQSAPLSMEYLAELPIDNQPPKAAYTHNTKVAGEAATFGGEAGDSGTVNGLARVVLWFSRDNGSGTETPIVWHKEHPGFVSGGTVPQGLISGTAGGTGWLGTGGSTSANMPNWESFKSSALENNFSCIVIERNDTRGQYVMYGHKRPIGFATIGAGSSGLDKGWYVTLDSTKMDSGKVTAHYIVYDKAGNATYYTQKLIIMNGVPLISGITLATDIRGDNGLTGAGGSFTANGSYGAGRSGTIDLSASPLDTIRGKFTTPAGLTDIQKGVSNVITVNTTTVKDLGVVYDEPFNVRNNLLAVKVEVTQDQGEGGKDRTFRVEYVSGGTRKSDTTNGNNFYKTIKAGRIYIVENPGNDFPWKALGAQLSSLDDKTIKRGAAFMAVENGDEVNIPTGDYRLNNIAPSVWELNTYYYNNPADSLDRGPIPAALRIGEVKYSNASSSTQGKSAEFVYAADAFDARQFDPGETSGPSSKIHDFIPAAQADGRPEPYPSSATRPPWEVHSLFIVKVFGGGESELFGDFALLSIRVNNDDRTLPYAQLYDLNPKTEGQDNTLSGNDSTAKQLTALKPTVGTTTMGVNRTKGGLWNTGTVLKVAKSGHIEPRRTTSLTSAQMGGAATPEAASITKPFLPNDAATRNARLFNVDTVSGDVILRGYVEDDQRIRDVSLVFYNNAGTVLQTVNILETKPNPSDTGNFGLQPATGANAAAANTVAWNETIDLYRHRVEWAYLWRTEQVPGGDNVVATGMNVRAIAYNAHNSFARNNPSVSWTRDEAAANAGRYDYFNPDYPTYTNADANANFQRYNQIPVNLRPYITGFRRDQSRFAHNTRSRQGWYMFAREETVVVAGFNLANGAGNNTNITVGGRQVSNIGDATALVNSHAVTGTNPDVFTGNGVRRFRAFTVSADAAGANTPAGTNPATPAGSSVIRLTVNNINAVNTYTGAANADGERKITADPIRPTNILPWNIEYSPGTNGSELWDDFTQAHIWQSNDNAPGGTGEPGRFSSTNNWIILSPAMSIDPTNGTLYESHNESGSGGRQNPNTGQPGGNSNTGTTRKNAITQQYVQLPVTQFVDPILFSDVYRSPGGGGTNGIAADTWAVSSIIGRSGTVQYWTALGGVYISGTGGNAVVLYGGGQTSSGTVVAENLNTSLYFVESTWYNASTINTGRTADPPSTDQFMNPHIVTSYTGTGANTREHIHVSYYDDKDHSLKYRYNLRGRAGTIDGGANTTATTGNNIPKMWTNLDGGFDAEDTDPTAYAHVDIGSTTANSITSGARVVRQNDRKTNKAGKHNSIAVTSDGYPVIAYYDEVNQRLKLAVSKSTAPILASNWVIRDHVIPSDDFNSSGTGEFVSMKIDTTVSPNKIHIAAMNTAKRLVYITGELHPPTNLTLGANGDQQDDQTSTNNVLREVKVQVVDSVGNVGRWCSLSLDSNGKPWISYMDESYLGARDGAKVAYLNETTFYKGGTASSYFTGQYSDIYGKSLAGWETMHVPTVHRVENPIEGPGREHGRLGMECFPTRNYSTTATKIWSAAVGYLSQDAEGNNAAMDRYRVAYYVK